MPCIRFRKKSNTCLVLEIRAQVFRAALWASPAVFYWFGFQMWGAGKIATLLWVLVGVVLLPVTTIKALRLLTPRKHTLVRVYGRLLLDGEPLEMTRLELRVRQIPILNIPLGYRLSFWVMTASGPLDIPLGHYRTLVSASQASGWLEEFINRTENRLHKHV